MVLMSATFVVHEEVIDPSFQFSEDVLSFRLVVEVDVGEVQLVNPFGVLTVVVGHQNHHLHLLSGLSR